MKIHLGHVVQAFGLITAMAGAFLLGAAVMGLAFDAPNPEGCVSSVQGRCIPLNEQEKENPCGRQ